MDTRGPNAQMEWERLLGHNEVAHPHSSSEASVTGSAQKVLHRKNLKASIGCRQSDWASGARNLQDHPQPRVLINLMSDQNKPIQQVSPSTIGTEQVVCHNEATRGSGKEVPGIRRQRKHTGNNCM
ncbi:uncharacterized protein UHOD_12164 [Ustilago sp. UG-2017b]|nr:uncharacterized protein UHOD_12164 [Ustilago sp. UG-2017b]